MEANNAPIRPEHPRGAELVSKRRFNSRRRVFVRAVLTERKLPDAPDLKALLGWLIGDSSIAYVREREPQAPRFVELKDAGYTEEAPSLVSEGYEALGDGGYRHLCATNSDGDQYDDQDL